MGVAVWMWQSQSLPTAVQSPAREDVQAAVGVIPDIQEPVSKPPFVAPAVDPKLPPVPMRVVRRQAPPFVEIGAMTSQPEESKEAFLVRLAQTMDAFTRATGHEACGLILKSNEAETYKVRLTTNRAHISCTMMSFREPGFHPIGEDIHSHPRIVGGVKSNRPDMRNRSDLRCGNRIIIYDETFSEVDFNNGPGYLVSRGRLLFQRGAQWPMRQVATFEAIEQAEPLEVGGVDPKRNEALAAAAWANEEMEGLPPTECAEEIEEVAQASTPNPAITGPR